MMNSWISTFLVPVDFSGNKTMWNYPTAYYTSGNHGVVLKLSPIIISPYGAERLMARLWLELASHQRGVWAALGHLMLQQGVNHTYAQKTSLCRAFGWHRVHLLVWNSQPLPPLTPRDMDRAARSTVQKILPSPRTESPQIFRSPRIEPSKSPSIPASPPTQLCTGTFQ